MSIHSTDTVRELAVGLPGATRIFEDLGIDYCCGGSHTLSEASLAANVPVERVVVLLEHADRAKQANILAPDWEGGTLAGLIVHILDTHHVFTKQELTRLAHLLAKVCAVHGENHPELLRLQTLFRGLSQELVPHMLKEEQVLFPYITRLEEAVNAGHTLSPPFFATVINPVRMMMQEHDTAGGALREIRLVTDDFNLPADACGSFKTLYQALQEFEKDLHQHIHLENNILFPRAIGLELSARPDWQDLPKGNSEHRCFGG